MKHPRDWFAPQNAWRYVSDAEVDLQLATDAFVNDLEPGDLMPHQILAIEEMFEVHIPAGVLV